METSVDCVMHEKVHKVHFSDTERPNVITRGIKSLCYFNLGKEWRLEITLACLLHYNIIEWGTRIPLSLYATPGKINKHRINLIMGEF